MRYLIVCLICLGSALMVYNIVRYYGFLSHIKKMESLGETRKTAVIPLVLLVCFLIGYLTVGFLGKPDIIVALILFGGSIYVSMVLMFLYRIVYQLEQNEIRMEALYKQVRSEVRSLTRNALAVFRVNLTRDVIEERGGTSLYESDYVQGSYTDLVNSRRHNILTRDSAAGFLSFDRDSLINCFEKGQTNVEEVLFCSGASGQACFVLAHASLAAQPVTGDVVAFITEKLYNDEMVNDTLLNRALVGQYDMIAYLVDGRYGVVIGEKEPDKQGNIFPDCNTGLYSDYLKDKLAPALCGTGDERAAIMESLSEKEVERQLSDKDSYDVSFSCEIDGELYYKNFSFYTVDAEAKFYVVLEYDTTEARQEEQVRAEKLEVALEEARRASAAKTVFLSNMSHDIRTPMNAIIGYVNMAKRDTTDSRLVSEYLDKIDSSSQYLLALINDVLEMSRIESGKLELEAVPVDLRKLLNEVRDMFATQMREKGIAFEVSYERLSDPGVLCDENRFNRVLLNLLSNAYKFTPENGSISVILRQNDTVKPGSGEYELRVKDSGIGMEPEFAERVFEAFERERNSTVSGIQGTGLGMAITKNIIDMMGGTIDVETAPGQGTEFIIRLSMPVCEDVEPFEAVAVEEKQDELTFSDFTSVHALLVEDVEVNREIATFMLEDMGFSIDTAENGRIAVEKVRASEPGYYDIILMDVQMPEMNGYEAARSIRSLPDPELSNIPIVAMTANAFSEDIREAKNAGMNDHISKPLDIEQMQETLKRVLGGAN